MTGVLLAVALSRIVRLPTLEMDVDEVWSIWQTLGTPQQIIQWTPYDWPPLYYLMLGGWKELAGITPFAAHVLSALAFLPGVACCYRLARRLGGAYGSVTASRLAALAYSGFGFMIYLSVIVRGYAFLLTLTPLAFWLALRYFETDRFRWPRAIPLGLCAAAMFYIHVTSIFAFALIALSIMPRCPRRVLRAWLPGLIAAGIALPEIWAKLSVALNPSRLAITTHLAPPPLASAMLSLIGDFAGEAVGVWIVLFILANVGMVLMARRSGRTAITLLPWLIAPLPMYLIYTWTAIIDARHLAWIMVGLALWIGLGLGALIDKLATGEPHVTRALRISGTVIALALLFVTIPNRYFIPGPPLMATFEALTHDLRGGDAILIDPNQREATPEEWDYYTRVYFPNGLPIVHDPMGYQRVWYVTKEGSHDPATDQAVTHGRIATQFFGPWNFLFRLYEAPPNPSGLLFANEMRFYGADLLNPDGSIDNGVSVRRTADSVRVRLWWSVDRPVGRDYSVSVRLVADGNPDDPSLAHKIVAQSDNAPQVAAPQPQATSQWQPGQLYVEERTLTLPDPTEKGTYGLYITVYQWQDMQPIMAPGTDANGLLRLHTLTVKSWP